MGFMTTFRQTFYRQTFLPYSTLSIMVIMVGVTLNHSIVFQYMEICTRMPFLNHLYL